MMYIAIFIAMVLYEYSAQLFGIFFSEIIYKRILMKRQDWYKLAIVKDEDCEIKNRLHDEWNTDYGRKILTKEYRCVLSRMNLDIDVERTISMIDSNEMFNSVEAVALAERGKVSDYGGSIVPEFEFVNNSGYVIKSDIFSDERYEFAVQIRRLLCESNMDSFKNFDMILNSEGAYVYYTKDKSLEEDARRIVNGKRWL